MLMNINTLKLDVNNTNVTYVLSNSSQLVIISARANVQLTAFTAKVTDIRTSLQGAFSNGGGWAWIFICTILTMLIVGYVSRFTLDGAGIIGAVFFEMMALICPVNLAVAGILMPMWAIGAIGIIVTLLLIIWRYL
jgi:hypothetical protein